MENEWEELRASSWLVMGTMNVDGTASTFLAAS